MDSGYEQIANEVLLDTGSERAAVATIRVITHGIVPCRRRRSLNRLKPAKDLAWITYKAEVWVMTEAQPLHELPNYERRSFSGWHVDHVLSIREAYLRGLPSSAAACMSNLRMIPADQNLKKSTKTVFTDLFNNT